MTEAVEVAFVFDTTGSMSPCIGQVRQNVEGALAPLLTEMPNLKISIGAHGDYCDARSSYVTKWLQPTNDIYSLAQFVRNVERTGGGDAEECYELVLHEARYLNWSMNSRKIVVMIGDDRPHSVSYPLNTKHLDWRVEAATLRDLGIAVYTVQALGKSYATPFWREVAEITGGYHLALGQFTDVVDLIKAILYRQEGPERLAKWEEEIASRGRMNRSLDASIAVLSGKPRDPATGRFISKRYGEVATGLSPVDPSRFQILSVERDQDIRGFVEDHEIEFMPGRGFYEFTKREEIQERKEVVLRDKRTGDMFSGPQARELIGLPFGERGRVSPGELPYQVFVQSTSYNRKLTKGANFLYEVNLDR